MKHPSPITLMKHPSSITQHLPLEGDTHHLPLEGELEGVSTHHPSPITHMKWIAAVAFVLMAIGIKANPVDDMLERIDPGASKKFKTELLKNDGREFFELDQQGNRIVVRGHNWIDVAVGVNWYLKHYAHIHLTWNQMQAHLPNILPPVRQREKHETQMALRYDFNYCTFSYSMAWWDWKRWEREIDWMALHGVNMPLAIVGEECVWRNMLLRLGYTEKEVGEFISGPAFLAWWAMNNLEGWGGPLPRSWYSRQEKLQKQILKRMREWGMQPVLPGYCGMMPHDAKERLGLNVTDGGLWNGYQRPANLLPTDPRFQEIAAIYYEELTRLFGQAKYYSMDPFHESNDDASIDYTAAGEALMKAMKHTNPAAIWVVQGWTENPRPQMLEKLHPQDMLILDLFSECRPMFGPVSIWRREGGYGDFPWLFCLLQNFGNNVGLHGRMDQLIGNFIQALPLEGELEGVSTQHPSPITQHLPLEGELEGVSTLPLEGELEGVSTQHPSPLIKGIGFTMEGSENNPVMFELMSELPWLPLGSVCRDSIATFKKRWLQSYTLARYGQPNEAINEAWDILSNSIYNCPPGNNQQGTHESIFCGRPSLNNFQASSWSKMKNYYDPDDTRQAALLMASVAEQYRGNNNFEYDLVDIVRQALADQARIQYQYAIADYKAFNRKQFERSSKRFLDMLLAQDRLLGTRLEFRLGHWTEAARSCGYTAEEQDLYEWNARVQITTWGNRTCADKGGLRDYAHKEWQGLLKDFYYVRWKTYFDALAKQMNMLSKPQPELLGTGANSNKTASELFQMSLPQEVSIDWYAIEEPWTLRHNTYSAQAEGNPIDIALDICKHFF